MTQYQSRREERGTAEAVTSTIGEPVTFTLMEERVGYILLLNERNVYPAIFNIFKGEYQTNESSYFSGGLWNTNF